MHRTMLLTMAIFAGSCAPVQAQADVDVCRTYADLAEQVMHNRQYGVPFNAMLDDLVAGPPAVVSASVSLVLQAYATPHYQDTRMKRSTIDQFSDTTHKQCLEGMNQ